MSSTLKAIRNLWQSSSQDQQQQQRTRTARHAGTKPKGRPSPPSQEGQKLARARAVVRDAPHGSSCRTATHRKKTRTPHGFSETRVWMLSRSLSTRRRAEAELQMRRDEAESRLLADKRSWASPVTLINLVLTSRSRHGAAVSCGGNLNGGTGRHDHPPAGRIPRIPSFQWARDGSFGSAVADGIRLCGTSLPAPEDDDDEVERYFLSRGRTTRGRKPPQQLFKPLPPLPSSPTTPPSIAVATPPPAHLDAIVPSTAARHLAAYLSLPASLAPEDVVDHVLARPNLRAAVSRLRAADADLFNSMPWAEIVASSGGRGAWGDDDHDSCSDGTHGQAPTPCCSATQQAWARLHARNAANKHRRQQEVAVVMAGSSIDQDLFPLESRRDQKRRVAAHSKAWQRGSPRVTGPAALYRVHDGVSCALSSSSSAAAPGREELVDDVLSWTRPGRSKLREVVVVG
ncbi:uncharacterized protein PgNI_04912 [Pyricularia grisea]|uniref:Uncharacterized protein n=1 Tax=Pyricularia grisea TaxID=148305 RepID=A0A6P8BC81_PYRGI|nr:uncharacterized protein PgNI_04912 [Pyricularia grisea]TLD13394.1 hypothetical protein PgNI_04912 [Pyricularia grisea]